MVVTQYGGGRQKKKGWGGNKLCKVSRHPYPQLGRGQGGMETETVTIMGGGGQETEACIS